MEDENKDSVDHQSKQKVFQRFKEAIYFLASLLKRFKEAIIILAALCTVIAFFRPCSNDNYEQTSIKHQPILKLAGIPDISDINIDTLSVKIRKQPNINSGTIEFPHIMNVSFIITIKAKIKITNASETSIGKIKFLLTTDKIKKVKDFVMGKYIPDNIETDFHKWPELENSQVPPLDTIELTRETKIRSDSDEKYVMHFLIVYLNDLGQLYHTHAKVPFEFNRPSFQPFKTKMTFKEAEKKMYKIVERLLRANSLMKPLNPVNDFEMYNRSEAELAKKNIKELIQKLSYD